MQIKGITISNTEEHPYWVVGKGWVEAKDLKIGDQVLLASGEKAAIENGTKEKLETPVKVYNFEVADWHTYFVADIGVLVHNDCTAMETVNSIGNGKQYSTLYEASTGKGASRSAHRNAANKEFYNQMANDAQFRKAMDDFFGYDVMGYMKSGKSVLKNPSKDWAWHHPTDTPGVVRLVPKNQHQSPLLQDILHPGPNGQGGFGLFK